MIFTLTGPTTLGTLIRSGNYNPDIFSDNSKFVTIRNLSFVYAAPVPPATWYAFTEQAPVFIEGASLRKFDWGTDTTSDGDESSLRWTATYFETWPEAGWDTGNPGVTKPDPTKYISEAEAYPILNGEVHNFSTYDVDNIHLTVCPWDTPQIYVFIE